MGSRYLFIVLYVFLEQHLTRGDYRRAADKPVSRTTRFAAADGRRSRSARALAGRLQAHRRR